MTANPRPTTLSDTARDAVVQAMRALICDISEREWAAGWMAGIELRLWRDIQRDDRPHYGYANHDLNMIPTLRELSALIDGWVDYDGYVPMAEWLFRIGRGAVSE